MGIPIKTGQTLYKTFLLYFARTHESNNVEDTNLYKAFFKKPLIKFRHGWGYCNRFLKKTEAVKKQLH